MHIDYQISEDDFVAAANLAIRKRTKASRYLVYFLPCVGTLLVLSAIFLIAEGYSWTGQIFSFAWGTLIIVCPLLLRPWQFRRTYRKMPLLQERRSLDIDADSIRFVSETSDSRTDWQNYIKFAENEKTFILFQQGNQIFIPLPKRGLSEMQISELRGLLDMHLSKVT